MDGSKIEYGGEKLFSTLNNTVSLEKFTQVQPNINGRDLQIICISMGYSAKYEKNSRINSVSTVQKYKFFENDLNVGSFVRAAAVSKAEDCKVLLFKFTNASVRDAVIKEMGCDSTYFPLISSIPSPTVRGSGVKRGNIGRVLTFNQNLSRHNTNSAFWKTEKDIDFNKDGGLYIEFNRFHYRDNKGRLQSPTILATIIQNCISASLSIPEIYGIKTCDIGRIRGKKNWISLFDYIEKLIVAEAKVINFSEVVYNHSKLSLIGLYKRFGGRYDANTRLSPEVLVNVKKYCTKEGDFTSFVDKVQKAKKIVHSYTKVSNLQHVIASLGLKDFVFSEFTKIELDKIEDEVYNKYSLLRMLNSNGNDDSYRAIAQYIDLLS
jgi:hypothetical protein